MAVTLYIDYQDYDGTWATAEVPAWQSTAAEIKRQIDAMSEGRDTYGPPMTARQVRRFRRDQRQLWRVYKRKVAYDRWYNETGRFLKSFYGEEHVMQSAAGFYIGTAYWDAEYRFWCPGSRESGYFATAKEAQAYLDQTSGIYPLELAA